MATYEIGAFTEAELLSQGTAGTNIGYGDTFVMPANTDVVMEVWDNDRYLSGDNWHNENANDQYGQNATITENGVVTSDGNQIYAEKYFWAYGSDGKWYILIEIEVEGQSGDYFSFYRGTPAEGTSLTIYCGGNVCGNWINYNKLMEPDNITPPLALDDLLSIMEDETGNLNILANDVDLDGGTITVTEVAGVAAGTPVEVFSAEGYSAMVTVQADGSMTIVPGPDFVQLTNGETTTVTFDYTITDNDGLTSTATVTVEVNGEITLDAADDAIIVMESEGAGDADGNVLDNDTVDGVAYDGSVTEVNGDDANVGVSVDGSNGGTIVINADGSFDFDANGEFDHLADGETAETTFSYQISSSGEVTAAQKQNILFVIDVSGSTSPATFAGGSVGDLNGDGLSNTILDAQIASYQALSAEIAAMNIDPAMVDIGLVAFSGSGVGTSGSITGDATILGTFNPGDAALDAALGNLSDSGSTNFEAALFDANAWMGSVGAGTNDNNVVFFLSDGLNNTGSSFTDEVASLESNYDAQMIAVGVGNNADLGQLNQIDNTGGAEIVTTTDALTASLIDGLVQTVDITDTATVTVTVVGEDNFTAVADTMTVFESEGAGDLDLLDNGDDSVLDNDLDGTGAYAGDVLKVNGDAANVAQVVAGSNGGLMTIYADGTMDFDANGEFEALGDADTAQTTFTYEIEDGQTATITVNVLGEVDFEAVDDTMTVTEDEGAGDADLLDSGAASVLDNDLVLNGGSAAYAGNVEAVNGDAANVAQVVVGSNGGLMTVNADGSVDFDANGEFDGLRDGESEVTEFTYTIADGKTATVSVTVEGDTDYYAFKDTMTVSESEAAGDADLLDNGDDSVLDNDLDETDAYMGEVEAVNGDAANVSSTGTSKPPSMVYVAGSAGGLLLINEDGTLDFDANGEFEALKAGETAVTTFTYEIADGEMAEVCVTVEGETDYYAFNDTMTVNADETAGDADILDTGAASALANDLMDDVAYTGDVLSVNNDAASVGVAVAGSNGGLMTLNADGTMDFDANGEFDDLLDGQSAQTLFTYEIADGKTATIAVTVNGQTVRDAINDVMTVSESEAAGDVDVLDSGDGSVLANDIQNGGAYTGVVGSVNGSISNVNSFVAGSNGGLLMVNADGTLDFDANGDFEALNEGDTDQTTFTYTLISGEEATITVNVEGEADYVANNDTITVMESETSGDTETLDSGATSILANDQKDGAAYAGNVEEVDGNAANIGQVVTGSNGGKATIYADGTIDFDANDEFDFLNAGETASTTFTYGIEGGETADVTVNVQGEDDTTGGGQVINLAIALSNYSTMGEASAAMDFSLPGFQDWNGNGVSNQVSDMAYLMVSSFLNDAFADAAAAGVTLNLSLVSFANTAVGEGAQWVTVNNAASAATALADRLAIDSSSSIGTGFDNANAWFDTVATAGDTNAVYVLGNGFAGDAWATNLSNLQADHGVSVDAWLPDLDAFQTTAGFAALSAMDDDPTATMIYIDDQALATAFGETAGQDALSLDDLIA